MQKIHTDLAISENDFEVLCCDKTEHNTTGLEV